MRLAVAALWVMGGALVLTYIACPYFFLPSELLVINGGEQDLVSGRIHLSSSSNEKQIPRLAPGDTARFKFRVTAEADYRIACTWQDGKALQDSFGYVTVGLVLSDTVTVAPSGVRYSNQPSIP